MVDLDELERLEREATPGPWGLWEGRLYIFAGPAEENSPGRLKGTRVTICHEDFLIREGEYQLVAKLGHAVGTPESDFNLIVAARNALPDLIAELRTLRARVAELERDAEEARSKALDEAIEWCRLTEAGDTNEDWRAAARCVRELVEKAKRGTGQDDDEG